MAGWTAVRAGRLIATIALASAALFAVPAVAAADATLHITSTSDELSSGDGSCSLREAVLVTSHFVRGASLHEEVQAAQEAPCGSREEVQEEEARLALPVHIPFTGSPQAVTMIRAPRRREEPR
jgi:hypothetical protein